MIGRALGGACIAIVLLTPLWARADDRALVRVIAEEAQVHTGPGFAFRVVYSAKLNEVLPAIGRAAPHERGADECGRRTKLEAHGPFHFLNVSSMCGLPARAGEERIPMVAIGCRLVWVESHA